MIFRLSRGNLNGFLKSLGYSKRRSNVDIYTSSNCIDTDGTERDPWTIFNYSTRRWASLITDENPWIQINLKNHYISLENYSIKHAEKVYSLRGWRFEASNDNFSSSVMLDNVSDNTIDADFTIVARPAKYDNDIAPAFNSFRISMTQKCISDAYMRICGIELFGRVFSSKECSLITKKRCSTIYLQIVFFGNAYLLNRKE